MTTLQQLTDAQASPEVPINENFETLSGAGIFGKRHAVTSGLTWGYYGGRYNGNDVADGTVTLTDDDDTYIVVKRSDGVVSAATATTNWDNATDYARLYQVTAASGAVTAVVDCRLDTGGLLNGGTSSGGGASDRSTATAVTSSSGTATLDYALGDYFTLALSENVTTLAFSNLPGSGKGATLMLQITQDATARTVTWPASFTWAGGTAGAVSTGSGDEDVLAITTFDNGTTWRATLAKAWA